MSADSVTFINGVMLTEAQEMALRVAVTSFHAEVSAENALEELGPIANAYRDRLSEILALMLTKPIA